MLVNTASPLLFDLLGVQAARQRLIDRQLNRNPLSLIRPTIRAGLMPVDDDDADAELPQQEGEWGNIVHHLIHR